MALTDRTHRVELLKQLQAPAGSLVIAYVTSTRANFEAHMTDDAVRVVYDHLAAHDFGGKRREDRQVDLLIHSNGGSGTMPWRLVNLIREFAGRFEVLVPHRAYSAATLVALGADRIVMHPMGELGPIDPSVANPFNPRDPGNNNQPIPISVEDVLAYLALVKEEVGVQDEMALVQAFAAFTSASQHPVHPLALGNVKRHHARAKMVAKKLLRKHMADDDESKIDRIVDDLTSKLYYHGHPISRREAKYDLELKVDLDAGPETIDTMWKLYCEYERELQLAVPFKLNVEFEEALSRQAPTPPGLPDAMGLPPGVPPAPRFQFVQGPMGAMPMALAQGGAPQTAILELQGAIIESVAALHVMETRMRVRKVIAGAGQEALNGEPLREQWTRHE